MDIARPNSSAPSPERPAAGRGFPEPAGASRLTFANIELYPSEYQVIVEGRRAPLTIREFQVLLVLAEHHDHVIDRAQIYERVWGGEMKQRERSADVFVRKVRLKLAASAPDWLYIHTHFGIGYRFAPERRIEDRG